MADVRHRPLGATLEWKWRDHATCCPNFWVSKFHDRVYWSFLSISSDSKVNREQCVDCSPFELSNTRFFKSVSQVSTSSLWSYQKLVSFGQALLSATRYVLEWASVSPSALQLQLPCLMRAKNGSFQAVPFFLVRSDIRLDGRPFHHLAIKFELPLYIRLNVGTSGSGRFFSVHCDVCWDVIIPVHQISTAQPDATKSWCLSVLVGFSRSDVRWDGYPFPHQSVIFLLLMLIPSIMFWFALAIGLP
jgi:hypothetical protein